MGEWTEHAGGPIKAEPVGPGALSPEGIPSMTFMSGLELRAFDVSDIPDAAALLADRHRRHRLAQPLLAKRYEQIEDAAEEIRAAFDSPDASGAVARHGGRLVGYLLGAPKPADVWGPNVWVEAAGVAVAEPEIARDLYGVAAARWMAEGRAAHYVVVPATDSQLIASWFRLGFGHQHTHAIRDVPDRPPPPAKLTIRPAVHADIPALARLELELPLHQGLSPVFSAARAPTLQESVADWESDWDSPEYAVFVAENDGTVVGSAVGCALTKSGAHSGLLRADGAGYLSFAAVFPHARGRGTGRALGEAVLDWAAKAGYASVAVDWRETNLLSSRTWPALGFVPTFLRLHRVVGY